MIPRQRSALMVLDSQAAVVDDLDDAAQAALVQLGRRHARQ